MANAATAASVRIPAGVHIWVAGIESAMQWLDNLS